MIVTEAQRKEFEENGVVLLRGALDLRWIDQLRSGFDANLEAPGTFFRTFVDEGEGRLLQYDSVIWPRIDAFRQFILNSPAGEIAAALMESSSVRLLNDAIFRRTTGTQTTSPFHQDMNYLCVTGEQVCSIWLPLMPVEARSALAFVPGTHASGASYARPFFYDGEFDNSEDREDYQPLPDVESDPEGHGVISWDMEPGDCVFFHFRTLHGGSGKLAPDRALSAITINMTGDDARVRMRRGNMEPDLAPICAISGLRDGDPFSGDAFPQMWPREI